MMQRILIKKSYLGELVLVKVLKNRAYEIAANPKYDGFKRGLTSMVYTFFDKKTVSGAIASLN